MAKHPDKCRYPKCHNWSDIIYLEKPLCDRHWDMIDTNPNLLRKRIGLPPYPPRPKPKKELKVLNRKVVYREQRPRRLLAVLLPSLRRNAVRLRERGLLPGVRRGAKRKRAMPKLRGGQ